MTLALLRGHYVRLSGIALLLYTSERSRQVCDIDFFRSHPYYIRYLMDIWTLVLKMGSNPSNPDGVNFSPGNIGALSTGTQLPCLTAVKIPKYLINLYRGSSASSILKTGGATAK